MTKICNKISPNSVRYFWQEAELSHSQTRSSCQWIFC